MNWLFPGEHPRLFGGIPAGGHLANFFAAAIRGRGHKVDVAPSGAEPARRTVEAGDHTAAVEELRKMIREVGP